MGFSRYSMQDNQGQRVPGSNDRRRICRYRVLYQDALIGWPEGSSFIQVRARLLDLSLAGCMLELPKRPARTARQPIWVRSLADSSETWVEGVVRLVRKPLMKRCRIRISFCDPFPYESFKKLVYGTADFRESMRDPAPPHERDHYWK